MDSRPQLHPITEDDIAHFLANTPGFFERHAELLASVRLTSPHSRRAISLQERQAELLRRKIHDLELRAAGMLRLGRDNEAIAERLQGWTLALLRTNCTRELPTLVEAGLKGRFDLPQVALRLWDLAPAYADLDLAQGVDERLRAWADALQRPYCGPCAGQQAITWLEQPDAAASVALLALRPARGRKAFGLLLLASPDPQRFQLSMETDFLRQLGDLAGAALSRLLPDNRPP